MRCACGSERIVSHGHVSSTHRALGDLGTVVVTQERRRWACADCRRTAVEPGVELDPDFRMTPDLVEAIEGECLVESHAEIAKRFEVSRDTVSAIADRLFARLGGETIRTSPGSTVVLRSIESGRHRPIVAFDSLGGEAIAVFEGPLDRRLLDGHRGSGMPTYVTDVPIARSLDAQGLRDRLAIHRCAAAKAVEGLLTSCWKAFVHSLPTGVARETRGLSDLATRHRYGIRQVEKDRLNDLCRRHPVVGSFVQAKDELLAVFENDREADALSAWMRWGKGLTDRLRLAFVPVVDWMRKWGRLVINAAFGRVLVATWDLTGAYDAMARPYDSIDRVVARHRAAIHQPALVGMAPELRGPSPFLSRWG